MGERMSCGRIHLRLLHRCPGGDDCRLACLQVCQRLVARDAGGVEVRLGDQVLFPQLPGAGEFRFRVGKRRPQLEGLGLCLRELRPRRFEVRLVGGRVELRDDVPGVDNRVEVDRERRDGARHLTAHLDHPGWLERRCREHLTGDGPSRGGRRHDGDVRAAARQEDDGEQDDHDDGCDECEKPVAHDLSACETRAGLSGQPQPLKGQR